MQTHDTGWFAGGETAGGEVARDAAFERMVVRDQF